jgi:hypothetical protein
MSLVYYLMPDDSILRSGRLSPQCNRPEQSLCMTLSKPDRGLFCYNQFPFCFWYVFSPPANSLMALVSFLPVLLRRLMTYLLVVVVLALGVVDPVLAMTDPLVGDTVERSLSQPRELVHASFDVLSVQDVGDESADLEQFLRTSSGGRLPLLTAGRTIPYPGALLPRRAAPPLFRPPSSAV